MESEADSATDADTKQTLGSKARALADKYLEDDEVLSSANGLLQKLNLPAITGKSVSQDLTSGATLSFAGVPTIEVAPQAPAQPPSPPVPPPPRVLPQQVNRPSVENANPAIAPSASGKVIPAPARRPPGSTPNLKVLAAAGSVALLLVVMLWLFSAPTHSGAQSLRPKPSLSNRLRPSRRRPSCRSSACRPIPPRAK